MTIPDTVAEAVAKMWLCRFIDWLYEERYYIAQEDIDFNLEGLDKEEVARIISIFLKELA